MLRVGTATRPGRSKITEDFLVKISGYFISYQTSIFLTGFDRLSALHENRRHDRVRRHRRHRSGVPQGRESGRGGVSGRGRRRVAFPAGGLGPALFFL
jgi:hypothetical protein